jgi:hypothetical protein
MSTGGLCTFQNPDTNRNFYTAKIRILRSP